MDRLNTLMGLLRSIHLRAAVNERVGTGALRLCPPYACFIRWSAFVLVSALTAGAPNPSMLENKVLQTSNEDLLRRQWKVITRVQRTCAAVLE